MSLKSFACVLFLALVASVSCFPEGRVVNGTNSHITSFPFIVSMRGASGSHLCGCSIIAPRWILTAAHCISGRIASQISIQYSTTQVSAKGNNVVGVKRIVKHENYAPLKRYANDIALLELEGQLVYNNKTLAPVTLPDSYFEIPQVPEGAPGILAGWGSSEAGGKVQTHLQEVNLKIYSDEECKSRHNNATTTDQICGGIDDGGKGQCSGDSGGPLLYKGNVQVGIVSWSIKPCAAPPYPGVYTKVSHYIDWIKKHIN